jgi:NAD(P)-dependent dehydrogenase (short-subunit alcohol dehydrogenase family)
MSYNPYSLENKTILVTGASSGIGKATAVECAKLGASVIVTAVKEDGHALPNIYINFPVAVLLAPTKGNVISFNEEHPLNGATASELADIEVTDNGIYTELKLVQLVNTSVEIDVTLDGIKNDFNFEQPENIPLFKTVIFDLFGIIHVSNSVQK